MLVESWLHQKSQYIKSNLFKSEKKKKKKKKDADVKAILEIEFVEQLKTSLGLKPDGTQSMFVLTILEKIKGTKLKVSQVREIVL